MKLYNVLLGLLLLGTMGYTVGYGEETLSNRYGSMESSNRVELPKNVKLDVVVTGTKSERLITDAPVKTTLIKRKAIVEKNAVSLADALEKETGLRVENNCENCGVPELRIIGLEGPYSQILIDGMPVVSHLAGVYYLEQFPAVMIGRMEVLKGGASALYGGSTVAGVVNIISRKPSDMAGIDYQYAVLGNSFTPVNNFNFYAGKKQKNSPVSAFFGGHVFTRGIYDRNGDGFSDLPRLKNISFNSEIFISPSEDDEIHLSLLRIQEERRGGNKLGLPPHEADLTESINTKQTGLLATWNHSFSLSSFLRIYGSYFDTYRDSYYGANHADAYGYTSNPDVYAGMDYQFEIFRNNSLLAGINYQLDLIHDEIPGYNRYIDSTNMVYAAFLQDDWKLSKKLEMLIGARLDKHNMISNLIISPRLSLKYKIVKSLDLRLTLSTGYKPPLNFDEDFHVGISYGEPFTVRLSPSLHEERAKSAVISVDYYNVFGFRKLSFGVDGFYTRLDGIHELQAVSGLTNVFERINGKGADIYGAEASLAFDLTKCLSLKTGFTVQNSHLDEPEPDYGATKLFKSPDAYGYFIIDAKPHKIKGLKIILSGDYTGSMLVPHYAGYIATNRLEVTKSMFTLDFKVSYKLINNRKYGLSIYGGVQNIFDIFQNDLDKGINRDAGYLYGPRKPRTIYLGIKGEY